MKRIGKLITMMLFVLTLIVPIVPAQAETLENNTFVVGMECNYAPFNWTLSH